MTPGYWMWPRRCTSPAYAHLARHPLKTKGKKLRGQPSNASIAAHLIACEILRIAQNETLLFSHRMYRTHNCNSLRKGDIGKQVTLAGWVHVSRDHGGVIFIDLRDREGLTQIVFRPEENAELAKEAHTFRSEDIVQVVGKVMARPPGAENPKLETGEVEVVAESMVVLNKALYLPFQLGAKVTNEELAATYRY